MIEDLTDLTGFSRRTIRYYIQEGLLDPPAGRGRGGFYFDSHLQRLLRIKSLQDQGLKLVEIRQILVKGRKEPHAYERDVWIRLPILPGIEIHVKKELEEEERNRVAKVIRIARNILRGGEE